jgi:hypothetical protein
MIQIDIQQIQTELLRLFAEGKLEEHIVLCKDGEPIADLDWSLCSWSKSKGPRPMGLAKGMVQIEPGFFEPLPPDVFADVDETGEKEP